MSKVNIRIDKEKFEKGWDKAITEIEIGRASCRERV